jgi:putative SOS response-associated peptidase YedK
MCNRFIVAGERIADILDALSVKGIVTAETLDIKPSDPAPAIARNPKVGRNDLLTTLWGFIPKSAGDEGNVRLLINARSESLHETNLFKDAFRSRRCIIPATAYFEFDDTSRYRVGLMDDSTMGLAGLYEPRVFRGRPMVSSTVITTEPNELIAQVHDRMPAILRKEDWEQWLDPSFYDVTTLRGMLEPYPTESMRMDFDGFRAAPRRKARA